ncbi:MAG: metal-sulfur cluster assembly factor [Spirochaetia bacterium]|nr:metal-sulfur cluster assembly factor [Spirochaetia bacterium]
MDQNEIVKKIWEEVATVEDPDLGMSLVELGLIYDVSFSEEDGTHIKMTLTSMACPMGPQLRNSVEESAKRVPEAGNVNVEIVWTPPWDPREMASEEAQMHLGIF